MRVRKKFLYVILGFLCIGCSGLIIVEPRRPSPWLEDPLFKAIAARLDSIQAIDNHSHLLRQGKFDPSTWQAPRFWMRTPIYERALTEAFGVPVGPGGIAEAAKLAEAERTRQVEKLGVHGYWLTHLDRARTSIVLVNQPTSEGTDGSRLRWVPYATFLLFPVPMHFPEASNRNYEKDIEELQATLLPRLLKDGGMEALPQDLGEYMRFVDLTLARWQGQGAVAVKFTDAYYRTLVFSEGPEECARDLYAKGLKVLLSRDEYFALQDFLARHIFLESGRLKLPVHIHTGTGLPPFLRSRDADVRNLEDVLTDVRFFQTQFVLIHAGNPQAEDTGYLGLKPNVWVDISALPFLYPVPDNARFLRTLLIWCPDKILFGTDAANLPWMPVGPDVMHLALCRQGREAFYLALAGLVRDGLLDMDKAVKMGEMVLCGNAERLYGFAAQKTNAGK
jgi:hypothetical protein